jgi:YgiT-type zinc finger domain-containing protein
MTNILPNQPERGFVTHTCSNCGKAARHIRGNYLFRESGLKNIVLKNAEIVKCDKCGNEDPIIARLDDVLKTIALALVNKPCALFGEEIRYLRKYLGMSGDTFASHLHVDKSVLSRWENNREIAGSRSDLLIRAIVLTLGRELIVDAERAVQNFTRIDESLRPVMVEVDAESLEFEYEAATV